MLDKIQNKVIGWYVYKENDTGRWVYGNQKPGNRKMASEGPYTFDRARDVSAQKNFEETGK